MQSGITASDELHKAFNSLLTPTSPTRALLATISPAPERLVPNDSIAARGSFVDDLASVVAALSDTEALYVLLREDASSGKSPQVVGVTYVPDAAPVRAKMLVAATRLTLVRELGGEHFSSTLFATTKEELSKEGWAKHVAHGELEAPLTAEEQSLKGIKEAEAVESGGTGGRRLGMGSASSGGVTMGIEPGAVEKLKELEKVEGGAVVLKIALPAELIALVSAHTAAEATPTTLQSLISDSEPRYTFYKHAATGAVLFIYTCPAGCSVKVRMVHAASTRSIPVVAEAQAGLQATKKIEASEIGEITPAAVLEEVEPKTETPKVGGASGGFARPKRPGRR